MWTLATTGSNSSLALDDADEEDEHGSSSSAGLMALVGLQLTVLVCVSVLGTFANALVFAVFYRRPSLRTISNRFVLSLILANLTSAVLSVPGHVYQLVSPFLNDDRLEVHQQSEGDDDDQVNGDATAAAGSWWRWQEQGLDGLDILVSLASVLSILLISLDRYYAVNSPLHYGIIVTRQKSMAMIGFVWFMAAILSAPVWAGSVRLVQLQSTYSSVFLSGTINNNNGSSSSSYTSSASDWDQQHLMDLCYSISLILFGFVWPLAALCWLYLRMYEAALKNSARTRRQSLCSNPTPADTTVVQHGGGNGENGPAAGSCPSLADALTSAGAAATVAAQSQTSANLLIAAAAAAAAAAASSNNNSNSNRTRRRDNRRWLQWSTMQQQLLTLLWREEGRPLRTTAMVISSFICCWLPYFVWLLPFQQQQRAYSVQTSIGFFFARLAAFSNVLISPAIYVYRNQVAQREACRVLLMLFCPLSKRARNASRFGAEALMMAASGLAQPNVPNGAGAMQYNHYPMQMQAAAVNNHQEEQQQQQNPLSPLLAAPCSRRTSSVATTNSLADSPQMAQRRTSEDHSASSVVVTVGSCSDGQQQQPPQLPPMTRPMSHVVNWRVRSGSIDCRILMHQHQLPADPMARLKKARASISGGYVSGGLLKVVKDDDSDEEEIESSKGIRSMRRRSQTISGEMSHHHSPDKELGGEAARMLVGHASSMGPLPPATGKVDRRHSHHHHNQHYINHQPDLVANRLNNQQAPVVFPSLDFFDTGLEDYSRRTSAVSFSCAQYIHQSSATTPTQPNSGHQRTRRRTCSFSKTLTRSTLAHSHTGAVPRWPVGLFTSSSPVGNKQIGSVALSSNTTTSSMPSVRHTGACLVTAV